MCSNKCGVRGIKDEFWTDGDSVDRGIEGACEGHKPLWDALNCKQKEDDGGQIEVNHSGKDQKRPSHFARVVCSTCLLYKTYVCLLILDRGDCADHANLAKAELL